MFFGGILKVNDEKKKDLDPNPDPLVRGMDLRIRIQIHTKMSLIRNTAYSTVFESHKNVRKVLELNSADGFLNKTQIFMQYYDRGFQNLSIQKILIYYN